MSRKRRFIAALGSGYLALIANVVFVVVSVPLALHYLTKEEFGLWSVVLQSTGYLSLLDFGVGQSVSRLLVDSKDNMEDGTYGSVLKTAIVVFALQAVTIGILGFTCSRVAGQLMNIPSSLSSTFESLLIWQSQVVAITFLVTPVIFIPLWSHQRSDLSNLSVVATFAVTLGFLWLGFALGLKTFSLLVSSIAGTAVSISLNGWAVVRLKLLPSQKNWGALSWDRFWEVFRFSRDLFAINLASQLISASQIVLVSRLIGLDAAAVWSICMKSFTMAQLLVCRVLDFSAAGLSEMIVRCEGARFRSRLGSIIAISAIGAGYFGVLGALGNRGFVQLWTNGRVTWNAWNDLFAGIYIICICVTRCYTGIVGLVKRVGSYKYVSLLEGILVIAGSIALVPHLQFLGVLSSSILANLLCSGLYGVVRVREYFDMSVAEVTSDWLSGPCRFILLFAFAGSAIFWAGSRFQGSLAFGCTAVLAGLIGLVLAFLVGLPTEFRKEIIAFTQKLGLRFS
jgi:O-antigen/teichoic acid export membrane protein